MYVALVARAGAEEPPAKRGRQSGHEGAGSRAANRQPGTVRTELEASHGLRAEGPNETEKGKLCQAT